MSRTHTPATPRLAVERLEDRLVPAFFNQFAVGADAGAGGHVKVFNSDGTLRFSFFAFPGFSGGVRVATGDVNGDLTDDVIVGAGPGSVGGHVKVFDGGTGALVASFFAFPGFAGGVNVAAGEVNGFGPADIVVGTATASSHVKVFDIGSDSPLASFFSLPGFTGGVTVAAGNFDGAGGADIVVGTASGASQVKVFDFQQNVLANFLASDSTAGVNVAAGDIRDRDNRAEILTAPATGAGPVQVFAGGTAASISSFDPGFGPGVNGLRVAVGDTTNDGIPEILVGPGPGTGAVVRAFDATLLTRVGTFTAFDGFLGGVFVG
jgi:hypothetical protein